MRYLYRYTSLLFFLFFTGLSVAQECDHYKDSMKSGNSIFLATRQKEDDTPNYPDAIVTRIDATGAEVWQTGIPMDDAIRNIILHDDAGDFLYMEVVHWGPGMKIYKINKDTGAIAGQSPLIQFSTSNGAVTRMVVGSEKLVLITPNSPNFVTLPGFIVYAIDKANMALASVIHNGTESLRGNLVQDSSGNLYYAYQYTFNTYTEPRIRKINGINFKATMWEKGYNNLLNPTLNELSQMLMDDQDNLYLLNGDSYVDIFKVDTANGNVIWTANGVNDSPSGGDTLTDHLFYNGFLYMSFHHKFYGSGIQSSFVVKKLNLGTGAQSWGSNYLLMTADPITAPTQYQGATSIDVGCDGSIYATGHSAGGPAAQVWCLMKIDGNTGEKLAEIVLDTDATESDYSHGYAVYNIDDQLVAVGEMAEGFNPVRALATPDTSLLTAGVSLPDCVLLSTGDIAKEPQLELYPNPTSGTIMLTVPGQQEISAIAVYDVSGREIAFWQGNQQQLSIAAFPSGLYLIKVMLQDGSVVYRKVIRK